MSDEAASNPVARTAPLLTRVLDAISWFCAAFAGVCMVALIAMFGWLVYGRYVLNDTPTWVEQVSKLLIPYIAFLGAAVGVREGFHLSIDFIREAMPGALRLVMRALSDLALILFGGLMAWYGWTLIMRNLERLMPLINISESWRAAPLAICGALIVIFGVGELIERLILNRRHPALDLAPSNDLARAEEQL